MRCFYLLLLMFGVLSTAHAQNFERYKTLPDTTIASKNLGFSKEIGITVPIEWQADVPQSFPVVVVFDRQNSRSHGYILQTIDYLTSNEQMPACVILSVTSTQEYRYLETLHPASDLKGLAIANEQFIFEELLPLAEKHYKAGSFRMFIGHSRYGYFTTALLKSRSSHLQAVISLSPFFAQKNIDLTDSIAKIDFSKIKAPLYYRYGIGNDYPEDYQKMEAVLQSMKQPRWNAKGRLFPAADHNVTPGLTIAQALYEVFEKWSVSQSKFFANEQKDLSILPSLESEILAAYGHPLAFSLGTLNGKGWYFYNEGAYQLAIEAWQKLLIYYPNFAEAYLYIIDAQQKLKLDTAKTAQQFLSSYANSAFYTKEEKAELLAEFEQMQLKN